MSELRSRPPIAPLVVNRSNNHSNNHSNNQSVKIAMPAADVLCKPVLSSINRNHQPSNQIKTFPKKLTVISTGDDDDTICPPIQTVNTNHQTNHQPISYVNRMPTISRAVSSPESPSHPTLIQSVNQHGPTSPIASAAPSAKRYTAIPSPRMQTSKPSKSTLSTPSTPKSPHLFSPVFHNPPHALEDVGVEPNVLVQKRQELKSTLQHIDHLSLNDQSEMVDEEEDLVLTGTYSCPSTPSHQSINHIDEFDPFLFIKSLPPSHIIYQSLNQPMKQSILPPKTDQKMTLVLDLDETLVHCSIHRLDAYDLTFPVLFNGMQYEVSVRIRPFLHEFLQALSGVFEVVLFTASQSLYADALLDLLDPGRKFIPHRVFRESCVCYQGNYLKDLTILGRPLDKIAIIDNSIQAFALQLDNGIPITSWYEDVNDQELKHLIPFLKTMAKQKDVRPFLREFFHLQEFVDSIGLKN